MAVWDKNYQRTIEANNLDHEVEQVLRPIFDKALENGMTPEDIFYVVSQVTQDWVLTTVLSARR